MVQLHTLVLRNSMVLKTFPERLKSTENRAVAETQALRAGWAGTREDPVPFPALPLTSWLPLDHLSEISGSL